MKKLKACSLFIFLALSGVATAEQTVLSSPEDRRIKTVAYNARDIVPITGHYFYQTVILFADDERIIDCGAGDPEGWIIQPLSTKNGLLIKPAGEKAASNMFCQTQKRRYQFDLRSATATSSSDPALTYQVRFTYPEDETAAAAQRAERAHDEVATVEQTTERAFSTAYAYTGSKALKPRTVIDDGKFTYFEFPRDARIPAIFAKDDAGGEILINHHVRGAYLVVERTAQEWVLRDGKQVTRVRNEAIEGEESDGPWYQKWKAL